MIEMAIIVIDRGDRRDDRSVAVVEIEETTAEAVVEMTAEVAEVVQEDNKQLPVTQLLGHGEYNNRSNRQPVTKTIIKCYSRKERSTEKHRKAA